MAIETLQEVKDWFKENNIQISENDIEKCFDFINNKIQRINNNDKQWVACKQKHEIETTQEAIEDILSFLNQKIDCTEESINKAIYETCLDFQHIKYKARIPFYIYVINILFIECE